MIPNKVFLDVRSEHAWVRDQLLFDFRFTLSQLNAEYHFSNYGRFSEQFEKGLTVSDEPRCAEIRRLLQLLLRTWDTVRNWLKVRGFVSHFGLEAQFESGYLKFIDLA